MAKCWPLQMPPTPKAVLMSLADNANDAGDCWPSLAKVCERTCFGKTAVIKAIAWLEEHGALEADRTNGRHSRYTVTPEKYVKEPVRETDRCASHTGAGDEPEPVRLADNRCASHTGPVRQADTNHQEPSFKATIREPSARGTRLPADWRPSDDLQAWTSRERPDLDPRRVLEQFRDYWRAVAGAKALKTDWDATWRNWVRNQRREPNAPTNALANVPGGGRKELK